MLTLLAKAQQLVLIDFSDEFNTVACSPISVLAAKILDGSRDPNFNVTLHSKTREK
tara:strand:- start:281 stop:448 length:168 start_codon:yes stop_codon:yes gene_type:complete